MREPYDSLFPTLQARAKTILERLPHCHGWDHTVRVWHNARHIARIEGADTAATEYAALLHDIGRVTEFEDQGKSCHATLGAQQVPDMLREIGVRDVDFIDHVVACVQTHRYRRRTAMRPATLEAKIVFDADKLDSMGAIGIGRAFHFAGRVGARVHNTQEEALASESYSTEDTAYREFLVKLRLLHEALLTDEGKRMGEARHRFMVDFFARLNLESEGEDYCS
ncbi:MAG: HD domain-containing protein [Candidatus Pacebacteria bacterium]|nr:HD domain-containing protein [Candidatus Paceibacterota bacterium]